jgi:hypothetical protein
MPIPRSPNDGQLAVKRGVSLSRLVAAYLEEMVRRTEPDQGGPLHEVVVPTLLVVEVAASTARVFDDMDTRIEARSKGKVYWSQGVWRFRQPSTP